MKVNEAEEIDRELRKVVTGRDGLLTIVMDFRSEDARFPELKTVARDTPAELANYLRAVAHRLDYLEND